MSCRGLSIMCHNGCGGLVMACCNRALVPCRIISAVVWHCLQMVCILLLVYLLHDSHRLSVFWYIRCALCMLHAIHQCGMLVFFRPGIVQ